MSLSKLIGENTETEAKSEPEAEADKDSIKDTTTVIDVEEVKRIKKEKELARRREHDREMRRRKREELEALRANQVQGLTLMMMIKGRFGCRSVSSEAEYIQTLRDLLDTLKEVQVLDDYKLIQK